MNEKLIAEFESLGCTNSKGALIALQVYLELTEVKKYWDVDYKYTETGGYIYFTAKKSKSDEDSVFIPVPYNEDLSFNTMQQYLKVCKVEQAFLVMVSSDSTCVYYQITAGLCEPKEISAKHLKENKQERRDVEIQKNKAVLQQAALCGLPVTLPKTTQGR